MRIFYIPSETTKGKNYNVRYFEESGKFACGCPAFAFSREDTPTCKHIAKAIEIMKGENEKTNN